MGMFGGPTTVPFGDIDELTLDYKVVDAGDGAYITVSCPVGYGNTYFATVADQRVVEVSHIAEGETKLIFARYDPEATAHAVSVFPLGDWDSTGDIDARISQDEFVSDKGGSVRVGWNAVMQVGEAWGDLAQLSAWSLTGLSRFATSRPGQIGTQAKIDVRISDSGGTRTVQLLLGDTVLASGSLAGDGVVTLTAQNDSGLSGQVTIAYTADVSADCWVTGCWCRKYTVDVGGVSTTVYDNGRGDRLSTTLDSVPAGVNAITITPFSDKGITGTPFTGSITVPGRPEAPGELSYASGNWTNTVVQALASATPGATYALFDCEELDGPIKFSEVAAVFVAGTGTISFTLPSLASAGTGLRRLCIVAQNLDVQDGVRRRLTIEYLAGAVVLPRPNIPAFDYARPEPVTSGRVIGVDWVYDSNSQVGVATKIVAFLVAEGAAVPADGATPDEQMNLSGGVDGIYRGRISLTAPIDGNFTVLVRAQTAAGTQSNNNNVLAEPVPVSNAVPAAPSDVEAVVVQ